jgi:hypothetical protein
MATLALSDFSVGANLESSIVGRIEYNSDIDHGERRYFGAVWSPNVLCRGLWWRNVK